MKYSIDKNNNPFSIQAHCCAARVLMEAFTHNMSIERDGASEAMFTKKDLERIGDAYVAHVMRIVEMTEACSVKIDKPFVVEVETTSYYEVTAKDKDEAIEKADKMFHEAVADNDVGRRFNAKEVLNA